MMNDPTENGYEEFYESDECSICYALMGTPDKTKAHEAWHRSLDDRLRTVADDASWGALNRPLR